MPHPSHPDHAAGHSPLPWTLGGGYTNYDGWSIHAAGDGCIAERWYKGSLPAEFLARAQGNAALIVKAVNHHHALVEALREVKRMAEHHHASEPKHFWLHALLVEIPSYIDAALAALDAEQGAR